MNNKLNRIISLMKDNQRLFLGITFGIFIFVLFFQPFSLIKFDFNNRLIFVAGMGAIVYLLLVLVRVVFPQLILKDWQNNRETEVPSVMRGFILLALNSVAFTFYLRYVGSVSINFYVMFKVIVICLAPPVSLWVYNTFRELKQQNEALIKEKESMQNQVEKYEEDYLNQSVEFVSENLNENLVLSLADIALIQSADNYVEIVHMDNAHFKKNLIRNTLKNVEQQLKPYSNFIRCHRTCIVNTYYIEKLHRNYQKQWLILKDYSEIIPVSRQYLSKLREII